MAGRQPSERALIDSVLEGSDLSEADLFFLLERGENQLLEFKDGKILDSIGSASLAIRKYISAFANADGGLLIVGVSDEKPHRVTPTRKPGGKALNEWAKDAALPITGYLSPLPRFQVLEVCGTEVLIVAISRAPMLVPVIEAGEPAYYLRIHDSAPRIPPYLIADLLLGRRQAARFDVTSVPVPINEYRGRGRRVQFRVAIENASLVAAKMVTAGMIAWTDSWDGNEGSVSDHLLSFIEISKRPTSNISVPNPKPVHLRAAEVASVLGVFQRQDFVMEQLLFSKPNVAVHMKSALYVVAEQQSPAWFEVQWTSPGPGLSNVLTTIEPCLARRPSVEWDVAR